MLPVMGTQTVNSTGTLDKIVKVSCSTAHATQLPVPGTSTATATSALAQWQRSGRPVPGARIISPHAAGIVLDGN